MTTMQYMTPDEIQRELGQRIRALRLTKRLTQEGVAKRADVSKMAVRSLEAGTGSSAATLIRVLKALDALSSLDALAPAPTVSPIAMLSGVRHPRRGTRH